MSVQSSSQTSSRPLRLLSIHGGQASVQDEQLLTTEYQISVPALGPEVPARLLVRHLRRGSFEALDLPRDSEISPEAYLVPQGIEHEGMTALTVRERRLSNSSRTCARGPQREQSPVSVFDASLRRQGPRRRSAWPPSVSSSAPFRRRCRERATAPPAR